MIKNQLFYIYHQKWTQFALLLGFCFVLFFLNLGRWDLWNPDEPRYARVTREMLQGEDWVLMHYSERPSAPHGPDFSQDLSSRQAWSLTISSPEPISIRPFFTTASLFCFFQWYRYRKEESLFKRIVEVTADASHELKTPFNPSFVMLEAKTKNKISLP